MNPYAIFEIEFDNTYLPVILSCNIFYVPIKPIIQNIGLDYNNEERKINSHYYTISCAEFDDQRIDRTINRILCIRLSDLNRYFQTIKIDFVPEFARKKLEKYQAYCAKDFYDCLHSANLDGVVSITTPLSPVFSEAITTYGWNDSALNRLGVYVGEPV